jgi:cystathionine beta-lyase family protein involved in aluminum resistance
MIGISGSSSQSLKAYGVKYEQIDLVNNQFDEEAIIQRLSRNDVRLAEIQRSRGYSSRLSLTVDQIGHIIRKIREVNKDVIIMVDNCYGELVEEREPGHAGADIVVGSLMKNLGGGVAATGGYVAGRKDLIAMVADRLTAPGIGREVGSYAASYRPFYQGLFMAPHTVCQAVMTAMLAARVFELLGYETTPSSLSPTRRERPLIPYLKSVGPGYTMTLLPLRSIIACSASPAPAAASTRAASPSPCRSKSSPSPESERAVPPREGEGRPRPRPSRAAARPG